tara:strand:- start:455 stop:1546 length:1092 start_codon:yes stop_codon:yes gene_type:complete
MKNAVIIGGGIHGFSCADELSKKGISVTVIEKFDGIFKGASGATHNRAHSGFHYPRSIDTAKECIAGLRYFEEYFPEFLSYPKEFYYFIEKNNTKTTTQQYIDFCQALDLDYRLTWPSDKLLDRTNIDSSFLVNEPCFNLKKIKDYYLNLVTQGKIGLITSFDVTKGDFLSDNKICISNSNGKSLILNADILINATYAYTNNVQQAFSVNEELSEYHLQTTEVAVVGSDKYIPPLTVMDGPFITILPNVGTKDEYLVYDVIHSVVSRERGLFYSRPDEINSMWPEMLSHGMEYFPFMKDLVYKRSNVASRPILVKTEDSDDRQTKIREHNCRSGFYSILEGKFISAAVVAEKLVSRIEEDGLL